MIWDNFCVNTIRDLDVEYIKRAIQIPFLGRFDCTRGSLCDSSDQKCDWCDWCDL